MFFLFRPFTFSFRYYDSLNMSDKIEISLKELEILDFSKYKKGKELRLIFNSVNLKSLNKEDVVITINKKMLNKYEND